MTSWYGLYEGVAVLDSIRNYGFAIRQTEIGSGVYECFFPCPEDDDCCIHITDISRLRIIDILEDAEELDAFLNDQRLTMSDIEGGISIVAILMYLNESYDIVSFFELQDGENVISRNDVAEIVLNSFRRVTRANYSYFDELLRSHGLNRCPEYLWKIKVTDDEYQRLKDYISRKIRNRADSESYDRETALLFAEFHRREYDYSDIGPTTLVYNSLGLQDDNLIDNRTFGNIASQGAERLGIQLYANDRATLYVYSLFYHGGLPLQKLSLRPSDPSWHRLIRYLLESDEPIDFNNFEDLVTGVTANHIYALKAFCQELQNAILTKDYLALPFYCSSETDPNYQMFLNLGQRAEAEIKSRNPFRLDWIFEVNMHRKIIRPKFSISGPDSISLDSEFINNNNIANVDCFTISSYEDGNELSNVTYRRSQNDFYGDRALNIESYYNANTSISIRCPELENDMLLSEELDNLSPQIISENEDGDYVVINNRYIGHKEVMVIVPDGWTINDEQNYYVDDGYDYLGCRAKIIVLRQGVENQSVVLNDVNGSRKIISATVPLTKVVVGSIEKVEHLGQSAFFNAKNLVYYLKRLDGRMRRISNDNLRFCSDRRTGIWLSEPPYGYIYVKSSDENNNVDPIKILNLGNAPRELRINYLHSDANTCCMSIEWDNGTVTCPTGQLRDNAWYINKNDLEDSRHVEFVLTPTKGNPFTLLVKTRFSDFVIFDDNGRPIENNSYISLADLPRFHYHIQDINFKINVRIEDCAMNGINNHRNENFTYIIRTENNHRERIEINIHDNINGSDSVHTISRESSLDHFFGGVEELNTLLNRHPGDMRSTEIIVSANVNSRPIIFRIKKFPLIFEKNDDNLIEVKRQSDHRPVTYNGIVKAMPLYDYEGVTPIELDQNKDGNYILPDEVCEWRDVLLCSGKGEWVLPHSIDCTINGERSKDQKDEILKSFFFPMKENEYPNATIWNKTWQRGCFWFEKAYKEHIPVSSLFDLQAIMSSSLLMARFVFNILLCGLKAGNFDDYKKWLKRALLEMAEENSFLWIWVKKYDCTFNNLGLENTNWNDLKGFLQGWYLYKQDFEGLQKLFTNEEPKEEDTQSFMFSFINEEYAGFISDLRNSSMDRFLDGNRRDYSSQDLMERLSNPNFLVPEYVTDTVDTLYFNPEDEMVFETFLNNEIKRRPKNFRLFYERAKMFFDAIKEDGTEDMFSYKPSIRKSVLYYTSHLKDLFIQLCTYNVN